jgi:TspO/MBR family
MNRVLALILLIAAVAFAVAPFVTPPFTGYEPGQFPVAIPDPAIQPAGYAFSIWSVIYLWLILHAGYGLWKREGSATWARVRVPLIVSLVLGTVWLAIAGASPEWATAVIWVMAATAVAAFLRAPTEPDRWILSAPLAIYAGWLTAATAVSTGVLIGGYGVMSDTRAALAMLGLVLVVALVVQWQKPRMPVYGLTVVWALIGVIVTNYTTNPLVAGTAAAGILILLIALVLMRRGRALVAA